MVGIAAVRFVVVEAVSVILGVAIAVDVGTLGLKVFVALRGGDRKDSTAMKKVVVEGRRNRIFRWPGDVRR